jgi:hypothetical protein
MDFFYLQFVGVTFVVDVTVCAPNSFYETLLCCIMPCVRSYVYLRGHEKLSLHLKVLKKISKVNSSSFSRAVHNGIQIVTSMTEGNVTNYKCIGVVIEKLLSLEGVVNSYSL